MSLSMLVSFMGCSRVPVQRRVSKAGLRLPSWERHAGKVGPWLASGKLTFKLSPPDKTRAQIVCTNNVMCAEYLLSSGKSVFQQLPGRGNQHDQYPIKTLDAQSVMGFLWQKHRTHVPAFFTPGERSTLVCFFMEERER